jgi:uncharacterized protein (DUF924 family)
METQQSVLEFWFGSSPDDQEVADEKSALWWSKNDPTDRLIQERFAGLVEAAARGDLNHWSSSRGLLALVILTDQFPRSIFRGTPRAFAYDHLARRWADQAVSEGRDRELRPIERLFLYLPFEHSESREHQDRCVDLCRVLVEAVRPYQRATFQWFLDYAVRPRDIIARFGRFPHRNAILGRESTPEEVRFLGEPGSSF